MNQASKNGHNQNLPEGSPCIWMDAGILSYQLCDREYDCENCTLDIALRNHHHRTGVVPRAPDAQMAGVEKIGGLRSEFSYSCAHCWLLPVENAGVRIGIEPVLAKALNLPRSVILRPVGDAVQEDHACAWIITDGGVYPVMSPANGKIVALNPGLTADATVLSRDPFGEGWLFEVDPESVEHGDRQPMNAARAEEYYARDTLRFTELLSKAMKAPPGLVGKTLADGGSRLLNISDILGPKKYFKILMEVFGNKAHTRH